MNDDKTQQPNTDTPDSSDLGVDIVSQEELQEPVNNADSSQVDEENGLNETPAEAEAAVESSETPTESPIETAVEATPTESEPASSIETTEEVTAETPVVEEPSVPGSRWYVVHTYSGHENRVAQTLKQRVESEHLEGKILDILVPTQEKIEIKGGKKATVKEKIFPGYILVKMVLDDVAWLAVRTTQGVTSFIGMSNKPTPIPDREVQTILKYMQQGGQPTYKSVFMEGDTVKIIDGPFAEFIGKVESVDKEKGKVKVLVSIFGRETPVELDFLQVSKL